MVVWFAHVRVGHRQTLIAKSPLRSRGGGFFLPGKSETGDGFKIRPLSPKKGKGQISNPSPGMFPFGDLPVTRSNVDFELVQI